MASIFTYDPDPPRVASPWLREANSSSADTARGHRIGRMQSTNDTLSSSLVPPEQSPHITRLEPEPQEGPVEYKLHLLLRPRRKFKSSTTGNRVSGSKHSNGGSIKPYRSASETILEPIHGAENTSPPQASTHQTRQHRLEQLTTQLLWRLQQSSPYHTSSARNTILPSLPEALPELEAPQRPAQLLHGLEESRGALYEIGVADDGTLVGLAEDEMRESLNNLRAMAACLGCCVEVLRQETVGECEWFEDIIVGRKDHKMSRTGKLLVVEAIVKPHLAYDANLDSSENEFDVSRPSTQHNAVHGNAAHTTEQLRVALLGPTMSGKSTLLGTLTTSTLDNGRGSSRLSMLKHRHEISSGVTSSVTQELLGYQDADLGRVQVINYATENVASWIDIHAAASGSRLLSISDSAGHPRYRRTTVRGLIGWAPHWTLLCIPADDAEIVTDNSTHQSQLSSAISEMELSEAQLQLCMKLHLPLVVVVTKLDLASKTGLKSRLAKLLDILKAAGRKPTILANPPGDVQEEELQNIDGSAIDGAYDSALPLLNDPLEAVPIVLTSAVHGTGVSNLHALLHELPIPEAKSSSHHETPTSHFEFHVEDIFSKPAEVDGLIISGLLRAGHIRVGDTGILGPFSTNELEDSEDSEDRPARQLHAHQKMPTSRSFPGALRDMHAPPHLQLPDREWRRVRITSVRNLRLPVHSLQTDQVGTVAILPIDAKGNGSGASTLGRIRKGMVLQNVQPIASRSFEAVFKREDVESMAVGNHIVVYIASIRASARVVSARAPDSPHQSRRESFNDDGFAFDEMRSSLADVEGQGARVAGAVTAKQLVVTFSFNASKEFVAVGEQVLVMPGGGPGLYGGHERGEKGVAGLEGFVGRIVECFG